jgi:tRNA (mo5U34)-methyltransferase
MLEKRRLRRRVQEVGFWWHSIDLGHGVVTPGAKSAATLAHELEAISLPDVRGRTVLDIGGWDGYFAFEVERRGARVAVLDHYMWSLDIPAQQAYWRDCLERGVPPRPYHETELWHPDTLPGKAGFDTAREILGSGVEEIVADFASCDLEAVGVWDVTLFLGVLYHLPDPLGGLRRLAAMTREVAVIETEAMVVPGFEHEPMWQFFPGAELNGDVSNWWAPNLEALLGALRPSGFARVEVKLGPGADIVDAAGGPHHYRAIVHAFKHDAPGRG